MSSLSSQEFPAPPRTVARVVFPESLRPTEHLPGTYRLKLTGWQAAQVKADTLAAILLDNGLIDSVDTWSKAVYYRLQNPMERFVCLQGLEDHHKLRAGDYYHVNFDPADKGRRGLLEIEEVGNERTKFMLQFVPPAASEDFVKELCRQAGIEAENL